MMRIFAPAKVNLFLHVGEKRPDGFHELESLVGFARVGDSLNLEAAETLSLTIDGPFGEGLSAGEDNLIVRAARALTAATGVKKGARMALTKCLPVASGIGGGSSDCAAALRGLNALWELGLSAEALREIGAELGSDVPVCIEPQPSWMTGRGENVRQLPAFAAPAMVLVNPKVPVPTGAVFRALKIRHGTGLPLPPAFGGMDDLIAYLQDTGNDLEAPARALAPAIDAVLTALVSLKGVRLARMSGSGATSFALFETENAAKTGAGALAAAHPDWWVAAG